MKKIAKNEMKKVVRVEAPVVLTPEQIVAIAGGTVLRGGNTTTRGRI